MGSELIDQDGKVCWGLKPSVLGTAWLMGHLDSLRVSDEDRAGGKRLRASRLVTFPAYIPDLFGLEPYTNLVRRVSQTCVDPRAVAEFPYDWRLSIDHNAAVLVKFCEVHLHSWRQIVAAERYADPDDVRLTIIAHSMGGLVARAAASTPGMSEAIRETITLGTPYFGAVKTLRLLETGAGAPVPKRAARALARTCPGVYDLIPRYRCVQDHADPEGLRFLTASDISAVGGDAEMAQEAADRWQRLRLSDKDAAQNRGNRAVVGARQPTLQSVSIVAGAGEYFETLEGTDHGGDSTVYRQSAAMLGMDAFPLPQKHGALARTEEAVGFVIDKLTGADSGPPLGTRPLGADIPDLIFAGKPGTVRVVGAEGNPKGITVQSVDLTIGRSTQWTNVVRDGSDLIYSYSDLRPGLHRIEVIGGGFSPVSDVALVTDTT